MAVFSPLSFSRASLSSSGTVSSLDSKMLLSWDDCDAVSESGPLFPHPANAVIDITNAAVKANTFFKFSLYLPYFLGCFSLWSYFIETTPSGKFINCLRCVQFLTYYLSSLFAFKGKNVWWDTAITLWEGEGLAWAGCSFWQQSAFLHLMHCGQWQPKAHIRCIRGKNGIYGNLWQWCRPKRCLFALGSMTLIWGL